MAILSCPTPRHSKPQTVTVLTFFLVTLMTEEQIDALRRLIEQEIRAAQIDSMEHGVWGWAEKMLEEGWQDFKDSFKSS